MLIRLQALAQWWARWAPRAGPHICGTVNIRDGRVDVHWAILKISDLACVLLEIYEHHLCECGEVRLQAVVQQFR